MGRLFADKLTSLLELHPQSEWINRDVIIGRIRAHPPEGFYFHDATSNKQQVISDDAISNALRDLNWWRLLEVEATRSRLTEKARALRVGKTVAKENFVPVLADILHKHTLDWVGADKDKALDVAGFISLVKTVTQGAVPSTHYLWGQVSKARPDIFNDKQLTERRFRQLLALLGSRGAGRLQEVRTQLHFLSDDSRISLIRD